MTFINNNLIVVASLLNKKLYLIEINENGCLIINSVDTKHYPDLIDYKDGIIVMGNDPYKDSYGSVSIYKLIENNFIHQKEIILKGISPHGIKILNESTLILTDKSVTTGGCIFLEIESEILSRFSDLNYYSKDIFINGNLLLVVSSGGHASNNRTSSNQLILSLLDINDFTLLDQLYLEDLIESITLTNEHIFITSQNNDSIIYCKLIENKLTFIKKIGGFNFPHGISSFENKVAVTNYGDNSVEIYDLEELIKD